MCERICPRCGSDDHIANNGICGTAIVCADCFLILANRFDREAAPLGLNDDDVENYALARSGVRPGAEARDPVDDEPFVGTVSFAA